MAEHDPATMQHEIEALRDNVERLNKELSRYQQAMGLDAPKAVPLPGEDLLPPWATNASLLSPLLLAYDNRIAELSQTLANARNALEEQTEKIKRLGNENNQLREEMERKWKSFAERQKQELEGGTISAGFYAQEKEEHLERIDLLTKENNILLEQLQAFKSRNDHLEQRAMQCEDLANKATQEVLEFQATFRATRQTNDQLQQDLQIAEDRLKRTVEQLSSLEREREESITNLTRAQAELKLSQQQAAHYREAFEDLDVKRKADVSNLRQQVQELSVKEREAVNRGFGLEREFDQIREQYDATRRELEDNKGELSHMLKSFEDMENQLNSLKSKEEGVNQLYKECTAKVREAELERDRMALNEQQLKRKLDFATDTAKRQEALLKSQFEGTIDGIRKKHKFALESRDRDLHDAQETATALQLQVEKLTRDLQGHRGDAEHAATLLEEERSRAIKRTAATEARCREIEERCAKEKQTLLAELYQLKTEKENWDRSVHNLEIANAGLSREAAAQRGTAQQLQEESRRLRAQAEDLLRERDSLVSQINSLRETCNGELRETVGVYNRKVAELEESIAQARFEQKEREAKAFDLLKLQEAHTQKWKDEHRETVVYFERMVAELNEENRRLQMRNKELGDSFPVRERIAAR